ncbi:MAG TPA: nicotinate-nucleotide diphosphorylase [Candidatus Paceibacterota bacterium]|nr:nicotinate-nucleotide diphosphorylase [Candidatus Paceibacterota bacterium]
MKLSAAEIRNAVQAALAEDIGGGDATTLATVLANAKAKAVMRAREPLVVAGIEFAETAFREVAEKYYWRDQFKTMWPRGGVAPLIQIRFENAVRDGRQANPGDTLLTVSGPARAILTAERVALNFVRRLSGVATLTSQFVEAIKGTRAQILDTRKTTPGWRRFEKYAVACGGGKNHRMGLFDMILIKDNHLAVVAQASCLRRAGRMPAAQLRSEKPDAVAAAVAHAREKFPKLKVEVEADTLKQVEQAANANADFILFDNMNLKSLRTAVKIVNGRAKTEASGGVNLKTVRAIAATGVDFISVGAITHSARAVDIGLDFEE